jgi:hypothetical protein
VRFGPWNIRNLYWAGSFPTVVREISRYTRKSDVMCVKEVRCHKGGSGSAGDYIWGQERRTQGLVEKSEEKRTLGRHRRKWENNIKMDLQEVGWGAWTGLIWLKIGSGSG